VNQQGGEARRAWPSNWQRDQPGCTHCHAGRVRLFSTRGVWFLAHSWAGSSSWPKGPRDCDHDACRQLRNLDVYAVRTPGQPKTDVTCKLTTTGSGWVGMNLSTVHRSRMAGPGPGAEVNSGWHKGDTLTCTGDGVQTLVLGHNAG